jgi:hypothetical protein
MGTQVPVSIGRATWLMGLSAGMSVATGFSFWQGVQAADRGWIEQGGVGLALVLSVGNLILWGYKWWVARVRRTEVKKRVAGLGVCRCRY